VVVVVLLLLGPEREPFERQKSADLLVATGVVWNGAAAGAAEAPFELRTVEVRRVCV
jgi:hypothetical protein